MPKVDNNINNNIRAMVPAGTNRDAPNNNEWAMVAQQFYWEDQIQALNLTDHQTVNLAQIDEVEDAEEQMKDLQIAFMVSTTPEPKQASETSCSPSCVANLNCAMSKLIH